jgi:hypothetical protein
MRTSVSWTAAGRKWFEENRKVTEALPEFPFTGYRVRESTWPCGPSTARSLLSLVGTIVGIVDVSGGRKARPISFGPAVEDLVQGWVDAAVITLLIHRRPSEKARRSSVSGS